MDLGKRVMMDLKKATTFYEIQDAVAFNNPIDNTHPFYTDFSGLRKDFNEKKIYRHLNIKPIDKTCNALSQPKRIFLSGHRGTGKTSELLKLTNLIDETRCYFVVFADLSVGDLDINNIDIVDILILLLEGLITKLERLGAKVENSILEPFYSWYSDRIEEINSSVDTSAEIDLQTKTGVTIPLFLKLLVNTKGKLLASQKTKETIRKVFTNKFSDFALKFNEFIFSLKEQLREKTSYEDLLFIVDGFEKIGSLENRKKVIIDDANRFNEIETNMIITLPIELFAEANKLQSFAAIISFPLVSLETEKAQAKFKEFILKRLDISLLKDASAIEKIIRFGAGSPRETLRIINAAYLEAEDEIIDDESVVRSVHVMGEEMYKYLEADEIKLLVDLYNGEKVPFSDTYANLLVEKMILDYGDIVKISPILLGNSKFKQLLN